jgi:hypothetical protein
VSQPLHLANIFSRTRELISHGIFISNFLLVSLPAFELSNDANDINKPTLAQQMKDLFSERKYANVAQCIAQYGAAQTGSNPSLEVGIHRLCTHFDKICNEFYQSKYVFAVIIDKVRSNNEQSMTSIRVNDLLDELTMKVSRTYLHVPKTFDFQIKGRGIDFNYWHRKSVLWSGLLCEVCQNFTNKYNLQGALLSLANLL